MTFFIAGLLLGLVGSGHCAVMCGPLVLATQPRFDRARIESRWLRLLVYHGGRILTYLLLALPAGLAGRLMSLHGLQRGAAVVGAIVLVAAAFGAGRTDIGVRLGRVSSTLAVRSCRMSLQWSRNRPWVGGFALGAANGLMPCGLVYAAAAASAGTGSIAAAGVMMLGFGLGTVPVLVIVSATATSLAVSIRTRLASLAPIVLIVAALLILVRAFDVPAATSHHGLPSEQLDVRR